jgi:hypothetical protein
MKRRKRDRQLSPPPSGSRMEMRKVRLLCWENTCHYHQQTPDHPHRLCRLLLLLLLLLFVLVLFLLELKQACG